MKRMRSFIIHIALIFFFISTSSAQIKDTSQLKNEQDLPVSNLIELRNQLDDTINDPNFANAFWGVYIKSLKTGEVLYKVNSDKLFIPASTIKIFTTSAALLLLGPDFQYKTTLLTEGKIKNGILKGNLIVRGSGDPTISNRFYGGSLTSVFERWADSLKMHGIRKIDGDIIGDDNAFDDLGLARGWSWDLESYWYMAPASALSFNDNLISITVKPTEPNMPAKVTAEPAVGGFNIVNKVLTSTDNKSEIEAFRKRGTNIISLQGNISNTDEMFQTYVTVKDPTEYTVSILKEVLIENGIEVVGTSYDLDNVTGEINYENTIPIFNHKSVMLIEIIKDINKNSNNFYAEQLIKTLGLELYNYGSVENGVNACKDLFYLMGINAENLVIADGSGLSKLNLITPKQIVNALTYIYKSDQFEEFYNSLPIAGVDGSLALRMKKSAATNNVRAKPGYSNNVRALAGYLRTADNEPLVFAILLNNFLVPSSLANYIHDSICQRLANFSRK
ncbi:MAG: D-alanyl-D-alanine carboxypeptidase/D-alanyl-D-alanine-endopeptidase [Melioribacteraceae bacterium]|nr:D-alanyl-D-alanine carboxypeptidase/D-alanyl-D-alanine-endopeptidase [Melioribacteraceae bacterium]MCF8352924.1 D-alanyl-D-alanine carboxypeptidase/D-alanyl-D-alanine-endopeptidase [Melioribacteraceae bacterium]MCF8395265.1 D-alanyl-D-alanine carboxypeptidase/D-alanyl-D-alanine-endopeptidase [Melioribacteraceae bacterium]MCF8417441.1 D-alanyl-D-alanine carboxypeptidase/D-alanyl-D-alanine-endopeptidase [Melioribacteraceae bacterium]